MGTSWMIILTISGSIGIALMFVGVLMSILTAVGNKHYIFGAVIFILFPAAFVYCFMFREEARYPAKLLYPGALLTLLTAALVFGLYYTSGMELVPIESANH